MSTPAFPSLLEWQRTPNDPEAFEVTNAHDGMSLRDYFAAAALQALIAKIPLHDRQGTLGVPSGDEIHDVRREVAQSAYDYADAMLEKRGHP